MRGNLDLFNDMINQTNKRYADKDYINEEYKSVGYFFEMQEVPEIPTLDEHMADPEPPEPIPAWPEVLDWPEVTTEGAASVASEIDEQELFLDSEADLNTVRDMEVLVDFPGDKNRVSVFADPSTAVDQ